MPSFSLPFLFSRLDEARDTLTRDTQLAATPEERAFVVGRRLFLNELEGWLAAARSRRAVRLPRFGVRERG